MPDFDGVLLMRICGISVCIASFAELVADLLQKGAPLQSDESSPTYSLSQNTEASVFRGRSFGVLAIPFCPPGLILVSYGFWPIGIRLSLATKVRLASLFVLGPFARGLVAP